MALFSSSLMTSVAFFHSKSKTLTERTQAPYESLYKSSHSARLVDVWETEINYCIDAAAADAEAASNSAIIKYTSVALTPVPGSNNQAYYYDNAGEFVKPWIAPTDVPHSVTGAPSYGFQMQLYQGGGSPLITPTEGRWVIDYYAGIVQFEVGYTPVDMGWGAIEATIYVYSGTNSDYIALSLVDEATHTSFISDKLPELVIDNDDIVWDLFPIDYNG